MLHASRIWCLVVAGSIFFVAQLCALNVLNPVRTPKCLPLPLCYWQAQLFLTTHRFFI